MNSRTRTIQDRIPDHPALDTLARLNAKVERDLYRELQSGRTFVGDLAKTFYQQHGISAKNLDHIHAALQGRIDSVRECAKSNVSTLEEKIKAKRHDIARQKGRAIKARNALARERAKHAHDAGVIAKLIRKRNAADYAIHQHGRRLDILLHKIEKARKRAVDPKLCFGSRELLRQRSRIDADDVEALTAWRAEWDRRRHLEVFVPGTALAPCGNEFVRLEVGDDGWSLVLRLPVALIHLADRIVRIAGVEIREVVVGKVRFPHGGAELRQTLEEQISGEKSPVTWRIQRHERGGWTVSCTFREVLPEQVVDDFAHGALGVDFNADHLALALTDGDGCLRRTWTIPFDTRGNSSDQNLDAARKAALEVARIAHGHYVPVVAETLDFSKKKAEVSSTMGPGYARMLHGLGYTLFGTALDSACARQGVLLKRVNPAYTSIIGYAKYARTYGADVHHAAACAIARRGQKFSERVPARVGIMLAAGVHGTLDRPGRIGRRHVWMQWAVVARRRKACVGSLLRERAAEARGGGRRASAPGPAAPSPAKGSKPAPATAGLSVATANAAHAAL